MSGCRRRTFSHSLAKFAANGPAQCALCSVRAALKWAGVCASARPPACLPAGRRAACEPQRAHAHGAPAARGERRARPLEEAAGSGRPVCSPKGHLGCF